MDGDLVGDGAVQDRSAQAQDRQRAGQADHGRGRRIALVAEVPDGVAVGVAAAPGALGGVVRVGLVVVRVVRTVVVGVADGVAVAAGVDGVEEPLGVRGRALDRRGLGNVDGHEERLSAAADVVGHADEGCLALVGRRERVADAAEVLAEVGRLDEQAAPGVAPLRLRRSRCNNHRIVAGATCRAVGMAGGDEGHVANRELCRGLAGSVVPAAVGRGYRYRVVRRAGKAAPAVIVQLRRRDARDPTGEPDQGEIVRAVDRVLGKQGREVRLAR